MRTARRILAALWAGSRGADRPPAVVLPAPMRGVVSYAEQEWVVVSIGYAPGAGRLFGSGAQLAVHLARVADARADGWAG